MKTLPALLSASLLIATPALAGEKEKGGADCHHPAKAAKAAPASPKAGNGWVLTRGEKVQAKGSNVGVAQLLKSPEAHEGKTVVVEGKVRKACEKKGCWMELATDEKGAGVRVTFKDYAFFVPLDSAGSDARVEGVVKVAQLSEDHAKHYENEGGIVPRGKDGKPREVQLVATGVELRR